MILKGLGAMTAAELKAAIAEEEERLAFARGQLLDANDPSIRLFWDGEIRTIEADIANMREQLGEQKEAARAASGGGGLDLKFLAVVGAALLGAKSVKGPVKQAAAAVGAGFITARALGVSQA